MSMVDELLERARAYTARFEPSQAAQKVAVVACMDSRLEVSDLLGLRVGEAHVIRNAGGVVSMDVLRSLAISQRLLGTREIMLVHHTDCGMTTFADEDLKAQIKEDTGISPSWAPEAFADAADDVKQSKARIAVDPFIPHKSEVRGFVFSVTDGTLVEVD